MRKPLFIVFDGLDCVGKTTTAKALANQLEGEYVSWLQEPFRSAIKTIWATPEVSENSAHLVFLGALRHLSEVVAKKLAQGTTVVADRYVFSTIAVYTPLAISRDLVPLKVHLADLDLLRPNFAFMLDLEERERRRRIRARGNDKSPTEILCEKKPAFLEEVKGSFAEQVQRADLIRLDVNGASTEAILSQVVQMIEIGQRDLSAF